MKKLLFFLLLSSPIYAADGITTGTLTISPSINAISVKAAFTGDDNGNATALVQYRVTGAMTWINAYTPYIDRRATLNSVANPYVNQARVSIVGLTEDEDYDVQITWTDSDGVTGTNPVMDTTTTISSTPPVDSATTRNVTDDATLATALAAANPGDLINLNGSFAYAPFTISRAGNSGAYIHYVCGAGSTISSTGNAAVTIAANYIVFDSCTFGDTYHTAILFSGTRTNIYIKSNTMTNISADCATDPSAGGNDAGVRMTANSTFIFILNNTITSTALLNPVCTLTPANISPGQAVLFNTPQSTIVVKGNTISGGFRDGISSSNSGNNLENVDIQANTISQAKDDLVDMKGFNINLRIWENVNTQNLGITCIAANTNTASVVYGPAYIFRNTCYIGLGATDAGTIYKIGGVPTYFFHNSANGTDKGTPSSTGFEANVCSGAICTSLVALNNIILTGRATIGLWHDGSTLDYDILKTVTGSSANYVRSWNGVTSYSTVATFRTGTSQELHGIQSDPLFLNAALEIDDTSPAFDVAVAIPNFNSLDSRWPYYGAAPDIGAFETGGVSLTSISPSTGAEGDVVSVTLTGLGFQGGNAAITVSGTGVTVGNLVVVSDTSITADFTIAASATVSTRNVTVTTDAGTSNAITFSVTCTSAALSFTDQPSSATLGATLGTTVVSILCGDASVNTASTAAVTVTKTAGATWDSLHSSTNTTKSAVAGLTTWTDLFVTPTVGTGTITATSSGLTNGVSGSITITDAIPTSGKGKMKARIR